MSDTPGIPADVKSEPDRPCVLPGDPSWIQDARYLDDDLLRFIASAALVAGDYRYVLPAVAYDVAAAAIGRLAMDLPATPEGRLYLLSQPAWELRHLQDVLQVLRRAQSGEPDTSELADLLQDLQKGPLTRTIDQCITDLQRVVAVLTLDTPAVRTLATALALDLPHDLAVREAYNRVRTGWAAAGVHC
jgi:hypothetical protein